MLHMLYGWEIGGATESLTQYVERTCRERVVATRCRRHLKALARTLEERRPQIDRVLQEAMSNWRLDRLAAIDRNILRIGVTELVYFDVVPAKVAIHEAILLAEKYGSEDSPRFVNGVLDAIYRNQLVAN